MQMPGGGSRPRLADANLSTLLTVPRSLAGDLVASLMSVGIGMPHQASLRETAGRSPGAPPVVLLLYRLRSLHKHHAVPSACQATTSYLFLLPSLSKSFPHASSVLLVHTSLLPLAFLSYTQASPNLGRAVPRCQSCPPYLADTHSPFSWLVQTSCYIDLGAGSLE